MPVRQTHATVNHSTLRNPQRAQRLTPKAHDRQWTPYFPPLEYLFLLVFYFSYPLFHTACSSPLYILSTTLFLTRLVSIYERNKVS